MLAPEGGPGDNNDNNGRAELTTDTHQMFAGEGPPTTAGDHSGRVDLIIDTHSVMAGGRLVGSDFHANAATTCDTDRCQVLRGDGPLGVGEGNAALSRGGGDFLVASIRGGASGDF